ncbi:MAG: hypothetical protein WD431_08845 [Cyclobacteriaceae bacterium]
MNENFSKAYDGFLQPGFIRIVVDGLFSLEIPDYLEKTAGLSEGAPFQYLNLTKKLLVIALWEEKSEVEKTDLVGDIIQYYNHVSQQVAQKLEEADIKRASSKWVHGLNALQGAVSGRFQGTSLRYVIEVLEGKTHYFQVICWTETRKLNEVAHDMHILINSFKELRRNNDNG